MDDGVVRTVLYFWEGLSHLALLFSIGAGRYVSPLFGVAIGGDVKYRLGWGLPFINRVQNFTVDGVGYDELPDLLLVGTHGYIAPMFWKVCAALLSRALP